MAATPESKVKKAIKAWLDRQTAYYTMPIGTGFGAHGVPDFLCCINGRFVGIEAKAPGKRNNTTMLQDRNLEAIKTAGGISIVVDDVSQLDAIIPHVRQSS